MNIDFQQPWVWALAAGAALLLFPNLLPTLLKLLSGLPKSLSGAASSLASGASGDGDGCEDALAAIATLHRRLDATKAPPEAFDQLSGLVKHVLCGVPHAKPEG